MRFMSTRSWVASIPRVAPGTEHTVFPLEEAGGMSGGNAIVPRIKAG